MIAFKCEGCGVTFKLPDDKAGKNGKCPKCGAVIAIPMPAAQAVCGVSSAATPPAVPAKRIAAAEPAVHDEIAREADNIVPKGKVPYSIFPRRRQRLLTEFCRDPLEKLRKLCEGDPRLEAVALQRLEAPLQSLPATLLAGAYRCWRSVGFDSSALGQLVPTVFAAQSRKADASRYMELTTIVSRLREPKWADYLISNFLPDLYESTISVSAETEPIYRRLLNYDSHPETRRRAAAILSRMRWQGETAYERAWMLTLANRYDEALALGRDGIVVLLMWGASGYRQAGQVMSVFERDLVKTKREIEATEAGRDDLFVWAWSDERRFRQDACAALDVILRTGFRVLDVRVYLQDELARRGHANFLDVAAEKRLVERGICKQPRSSLEDLSDALEPIGFALGKIQPIQTSPLQPFVWDCVETIDAQLRANGTFRTSVCRSKPMVEWVDARVQHELRWVRELKNAGLLQFFTFECGPGKTIIFRVALGAVQGAPPSTVAVSQQTESPSTVSSAIRDVQILLEPGGAIAAAMAGGSTVAFLSYEKLIAAADQGLHLQGKLMAYCSGKSFRLETVDEMDDAGWKAFIDSRGSEWQRFWSRTSQGRWNVIVYWSSGLQDDGSENHQVR